MAVIRLDLVVSTLRTINDNMENVMNSDEDNLVNNLDSTWASRYNVTELRDSIALGWYDLLQAWRYVTKYAEAETDHDFEMAQQFFTSARLRRKDGLHRTTVEAFRNEYLRYTKIVPEWQDFAELVLLTDENNQAVPSLHNVAAGFTGFVGAAIESNLICFRTNCLNGEDNIRDGKKCTSALKVWQLRQIF